MPKLYKYGGIEYVKSDLRCLKKWKSLVDDIERQLKIIYGMLTDNVSPIPAPTDPLITEALLDGIRIRIYKTEIPITCHQISHRKGARLLYSFIETDDAFSFVPILVFAAYEEGTYYSIQGKRIELKASGLKRIVEEKLR